MRKNIHYIVVTVAITSIVMFIICLTIIFRYESKIATLEKDYQALKLSDYEQLQVIDKQYKRIIEARLNAHGIAKYKWYDENLLPPLEGDGIIVSSGYGMRLLFGRWSMHYGIDLLPLYDLSVYASEDSVVKNVFYNAVYGLTVQLESDKYIITYSHLELAKVVKGQAVYKGMEIGYVGETGETTGRHLHYAIAKKIDDVPYSINPFVNTTYTRVVDTSKHKNKY